MSTYRTALESLGLPDDVVRLHVLDNDIGLFRNRDSEAYGRIYERDETLDGRYPSTDNHWSGK